MGEVENLIVLLLRIQLQKHREDCRHWVGGVDRCFSVAYFLKILSMPNEIFSNFPIIWFESPCLNRKCALTFSNLFGRK